MRRRLQADDVDARVVEQESDIARAGIPERGHRAESPVLLE